MAETLATDFAEETKSGISSEDSRSDLALEANSDGYLAIDVTNLSLLAAAAAGDLDFAAGNRTPVKKSLSRKGSQRGGERKSPECAAVLVHVAGDGEEGTLRPVTTITAGLAGVSGRCRRLAFRRPARWLDPRRVLIFFATLSSVGTLILLYFTLFMGSIPDSTDE